MELASESMGRHAVVRSKYAVGMESRYVKLNPHENTVQVMLTPPAPNSGSKDDFSASEWTNLNGFVARLTALSLSLSIPAFDFSLYAIWAMRSAYEKNEADAAAVEAAKIWFVYAKEAMEKLSRDGKSFEGPIAKAGEKYADRDWKGFSEERLAVWKAE